METKDTTTFLTVKLEESGIRYSFGSKIDLNFYIYDKGNGKMLSYQSLSFAEDEFKEFREMIRDFYTKKEQEEHFAMMSQRDPEAPSYTMTDMMVDKGSI